LNVCAFVAVAPTVGPEEWRRRLDGLKRFYGGVVPGDLVVQTFPGGVIGRFGGERDRPSCVIGEDRGGLLEALRRRDEAALREHQGSWAAFATTAAGVAVASGGAAPTMLYEASTVLGGAWSTHAVAAALLAHGKATIDVHRLPELLAGEFILNGGTLLSGVVACPSGTLMTYDEGERPRRRSYWSLAERWAVVAERDALEEGLVALETTLSQRVDDAPVAVALTGGIDSRVVAAVLAHRAAAPVTFTWGWPEVGESAAAARVADALGLAHQVRAPAVHAEDDVLAEQMREACWGDGCLPLSPFMRATWPEGRTAVTGAGGETGRAFYHRHIARAHPRARGAQLRRLVRLDNRIAWASADAQATVRARVDLNLEVIADVTGHDGFRLLDVFYGEERVGRWGRSMLPCVPDAVVAAFTAPDVQRCLVSLPLEARLTDEFHRNAIGRHAPQVMPAPAHAQRRGVPAPARRLARRLRSARASPPGMSAPDVPALPDWFDDLVFAWPAAHDVLGRPGVHDLRGRARAGSDAARRQACWLAGAALLAHATAAVERP